MVERSAAAPLSIFRRVDPIAMPIEDPSGVGTTLSPFRGRDAHDPAAGVRQPGGVHSAITVVNPWRCIAAHRLLGGISRARRQVHRRFCASAQPRASDRAGPRHKDAKEVTASDAAPAERCPFPPARGEHYCASAISSTAVSVLIPRPLWAVQLLMKPEGCPPPPTRCPARAPPYVVQLREQAVSLRAGDLPICTEADAAIRAVDRITIRNTPTAMRCRRRPSPTRGRYTRRAPPFATGPRVLHRGI